MTGNRRGQKPIEQMSAKDFAAMFAGQGFAHLHKHSAANQYHVIIGPDYRPNKGGQAAVCGGERVCLKVPWPKRSRPS